MDVKRRRMLLWGSLILMLVAGLGYALLPQPVPVDLTVAEQGRLTVTIDEEGETRVRDVYTLDAPLAGHLLRIGTEAGDPVEAEVTELARIEPATPAFLDVRSEAEQRAAIEAAEAARDLAAAERERAEADLAFATSELARARRLRRAGSIAQRSLDDAERAHRVARAELARTRAALEMREHELAQARSRLLTRQEIAGASEHCECLPVTAPVDGVVLRVLRESAGVVDAGTPLLEVGDPRDLEIIVDLLSEDAVRIAAGQRARIVGWGGPPLAARVRRIEPLGHTRVSALGIEEQRVDVLLDFTDPPERWARLGHGYRVDVRVILFDEEVLKLPQGALFRPAEDAATPDDAWAVFVVEDGEVRRRTVTVGERSSLEVEIRDGLAAGERVVLYPNDRLSDGVRVTER
ncbi:efflux RND transporter periplasmic adaptor subunit [Halomonas nitroreducens]|uniref:HlyD family efflux transporter periplasmic adaptor subunit n=1 Tax=Halomonas nitroreducens TaxID=447425 RepID=A0A431V3E1_9GAMM|nr:HlyD family efflux transporter periplasmic adaptor subunit [Halomonas nitroreducens]RTR03870.1 HlyD family efflux transporter periplasmic adaptor subunit [Halomonas nitroreducens]